MTDREKDKTPHKVVCPCCGYEMPVYYNDTAECDGVTVTCKGRNCHAVISIKIKSGKQIK